MANTVSPATTTVPTKANAKPKSVPPAPTPITQPPGWPAPLDLPAFHGPVGVFVNAVAPHTESDPAAILIQTLVAFGNVIGRGAHFRVEADDHYMNLFATLVGPTARSRKGTSLGHVTRMFRGIDPTWQTKSGLTSGEGLIYHARDEVLDADGNVVDSGVIDKRLFVIEAEFASTLKVIDRNASTLSPTLRDAWDGKSPLQVLAKNSPTIATDAHISVIGHITEHEVRRLLNESEMANGFANRFLWVATRRSRQLPDGGSLDQKSLVALTKDLRGAVVFGKKAGLMTRSAEANTAWADLYQRLTEDRLGMVGAVTARAEAQVMRLACIYALLDGSTTVEDVHLRAGAGVWAYCDRSAQYIFRDLTGNGDADKILDAIRASSSGLSRTQIRDLFGRNKSGRSIEEILRRLDDDGLIIKEVEETGGRPADIFRAAPIASPAP